MCIRVPLPCSDAKRQKSYGEGYWKNLRKSWRILTSFECDAEELLGPPGIELDIRLLDKPVLVAMVDPGGVDPDQVLVDPSVLEGLGCSWALLGLVSKQLGDEVLGVGTHSLPDLGIEVEGTLLDGLHDLVI